jgi:hypothetical protein
MKTLLLLILVTIFGCKDPDKPLPGHIPFILVNNIPVVEGTLNGKKVNLIVDSGASISVLDLNQQKSLRFMSYESSSTAVGYGGVANFRAAQGIDLVLGDSIQVKTDFRAQDLSALVSMIKNDQGVRISGILGSDVWKNLHAVIDYRNQVLIVTKR